MRSIVKMRIETLLETYRKQVKEFGAESSKVRDTVKLIEAGLRMLGIKEDVDYYISKNIKF